MINIKHIFKDITNILYHCSLLLSGSVIAQIISVLVYPFLTRLYTPFQFGQFSVFLTIVGVLAIASTGRFEYAIMLPSDEKEADDLKLLGLRWCLVFCSSILVIILVAGQFIPSSSKIPGLYFIPFYVFFMGVFQIYSLYRNRQKEYKKLAQVSIYQNAATTGSKLIFGVSGFLNRGLILGSSLGQLIAVLLISKCLTHTFFKRKPLKYVLKKYAAFPKYRMVQALINSFSVNLPILFITFYYSAKDAGFFAIILGIGYKVITLVVSSLYQVMYQRFAELKTQNQPILPVYKKMSILLLGTSVLVGIPLFLFSTPLISLYLGISWVEAGLYLKIMLPWLIMVMLVSPFAFIADIFSLQKKVLVFDIIHLFLRALGLYAGLLQKNVHLSVSLYCLLSVGFLFFIEIWYFWIIRNSDAKRQPC